jgi:hypothetical protein
MLKNEDMYTLEKDLHHISNTLLLNGTLLNCPGLLHGKTGILIFFMHYADYTQNKLFTDYASDLITEIQSQVLYNFTPHYDRGIAGVGIGFGYLMENNLLYAPENIFDDFDNKLYNKIMFDKCNNFTLHNGLIGLGRYWMMRIRQQNTLQQAHDCLLKIVNQIENKIVHANEKEYTDIYNFMTELQTVSGFEHCYNIVEHLNISFTENSLLAEIKDLEMNKRPSMGLLNGYAGEGMKRLTTLKYIDSSWMKLL